MSKPEKEALHKEVKKIAEKLTLEKQKKGDLIRVFFHKFKLKTTDYLLVYRVIGSDSELVIIGAHENYYRDPMPSYTKFGYSQVHL